MRRATQRGAAGSNSATPEPVRRLVVAFIATALVAVGCGDGSSGSFSGATGFPDGVPFERVSLATDGSEGNDGTDGGFLSADGRFVVFASFATNFVANDTNNRADVFIHDRETGETSIVSLNSTGGPANNGSFGPSVSADGRVVAFGSNATDLVAGGTTLTFQIFVHDRQSAETRLVSADSNGVEGDGSSQNPEISANGRFVVFSSIATNLVPNDTNGEGDIFIKDLETGETSLVSVDASGGASDGSSSSEPSVSGDGRFVVFASEATDLVASPTTGQQVFIRDRQTGATTLVSASPTGDPGDDTSDGATVSGDGRFVVFESDATNLGPASNGFTQIYRRDIQTGTTVLVSADAAGDPGDKSSSEARVSTDGRFVAWATEANLVAGLITSVPFQARIFLRDVQAGQTRLVSVNDAGTQADTSSFQAAISADGRYVAFGTDAGNLVAGDTNASSDIFVTPVVP